MLKMPLSIMRCLTRLLHLLKVSGGQTLHACWPALHTHGHSPPSAGARIMFAISPSSAAAERVFSILAIFLAQPETAHWRILLRALSRSGSTTSKEKRKEGGGGARSSSSRARAGRLTLESPLNPNPHPREFPRNWLFWVPNFHEIRSINSR